MKKKAISFKLKYMDINIFWAALSGMLLSAAFPKTGFSGIVWVALVPLLFTLRHMPVKNSFFMGWVAGMTHCMTLLYWVVHAMVVYGGLPVWLSIIALFFLSAYLSLYIACFTSGLVWLCKKPAGLWIGIPTLWVSLEYIRSFLLTGFPWELLGHSQFRVLELIQISDIFGAYGVSFVIMLINGTGLLTFLYLKKLDWHGSMIRKQLWLGTSITAVFIVGMTWGYGMGRVDALDAKIRQSPTIRAGIVQGNIEQSIKWKREFKEKTIQKYIDLSHSMQKDKPDIIVWPESATPFYFNYEAEMTLKVLKGIQPMNAGLLFGSPSFTGWGDEMVFHNSAYIVDRKGEITQKYDKSHLVPYGEYVPFKKWLPFIGKIVEHVGDFKPGEVGKTIRFENYPIGVLICYESIFSYISRAMCRNGAVLLAVLTNDSWYGTTSAPYQHFSMAVFRAVESKRSLVRSANTGISGFIDPLGRILAATPLFEDASLCESLPILYDITLFVRFGDWFAQTCLLTIGIAFIVSFIGIRNAKPKIRKKI